MLAMNNLKTVGSGLKKNDYDEGAIFSQASNDYQHL